VLCDVTNILYGARTWTILSLLLFAPVVGIYRGLYQIRHEYVAILVHAFLHIHYSVLVAQARDGGDSGRHNGSDKKTPTVLYKSRYTA